jgi:hypothetical protein
VPVDVPVPERLESGEDAWIVVPGAEGAPEPRPWVHAGRLCDRRRPIVDVGREPLAEEQGHPCVVVRVHPHEVPVGGDPGGGRRG